MKKNMIQWFISLCSVLIFSTLAIALKWQRLEQDHLLTGGSSREDSPNSFSRIMLMKAIAIFYFKSTVEILCKEYQQEKFLRLEYESLLYKVTDFRLDVLVPDFKQELEHPFPKPVQTETRLGHILLGKGKRIAIEFDFTSPARDAISVKNSPFLSVASEEPLYDLPHKISPLYKQLPLASQQPQSLGESREFQEVLRYLIDISGLRKQRQIHISACWKTSRNR